MTNEDRIAAFIGHWSLNIWSFRHGVRSVAASARLAVNQKVWVRLPSDTLGRDQGKGIGDREILFPFPAPHSLVPAFTRVCSWESKQPPKLPHGVRLLALVLEADVARREQRAGLDSKASSWFDFR